MVEALVVFVLGTIFGAAVGLVVTAVVHLDPLEYWIVLLGSGVFGVALIGRLMQEK